jgi:multisubunit Na+/H+ antiporter MnhB subunit
MSGTTEHTEIKMGSERGFGIVFGCVFALVAAWPLASGGDLRLWATAVSAVFFLLAATYPLCLAPLNRLWFRFGLAIGRIMAPLVMALIYFAAVVPTGLIMSLLGHDLLRQRIDKSADSYWIDRTDDVGSMKNQF